MKHIWRYEMYLIFTLIRNESILSTWCSWVQWTIRCTQSATTLTITDLVNLSTTARAFSCNNLYQHDRNRRNSSSDTSHKAKRIDAILKFVTTQRPKNNNNSFTLIFNLNALLFATQALVLRARRSQVASVQTINFNIMILIEKYLFLMYLLGSMHRLCHCFYGWSGFNREARCTFLENWMFGLMHLLRHRSFVWSEFWLIWTVSFFLSSEEGWIIVMDCWIWGLTKFKCR